MAWRPSPRCGQWLVLGMHEVAVRVDVNELPAVGRVVGIAHPPGRGFPERVPELAQLASIGLPVVIVSSSVLTWA